MDIFLIGVLSCSLVLLVVFLYYEYKDMQANAVVRMKENDRNEAEIQALRYKIDRIDVRTKELQSQNARIYREIWEFKNPPINPRKNEK